MPTSASEGGEARARGSATTSPGLPASTASRPMISRTSAAIGCRCAAWQPAPAVGRVLLVGDAAGLVDPLSGDGMYEAFVSARLASEAILRATSPATRPRLSAALDRHAAASWAAKRAFDRHPRAVFAAARAPGVFKVVAGLLCGDVAHPADARGVARGPLKLIARLAG